MFIPVYPSKNEIKVLFNRTYIFFRFVFLFFLNVQFYFCQEKKNIAKDDAIIISVSIGAILYSSDTKFNQQIENIRVPDDKIVIKKGFCRSTHYVVITSENGLKTKIKSKIFNTQYVNFHEKEEHLHRVQEKIDSHKTKVDNHIKIDFKNHPFSDNFSEKKKGNSFYVNERNQSQSSHTDYINKYISYLNPNLQFLYLAEHNHHHNHPQDLSFKNFFSVRPPPC